MDRDRLMGRRILLSSLIALVHLVSPLVPSSIHECDPLRSRYPAPAASQSQPRSWHLTCMRLALEQAEAALKASFSAPHTNKILTSMSWKSIYAFCEHRLCITMQLPSKIPVSMFLYVCARVCVCADGRGARRVRHSGAAKRGGTRFQRKDSDSSLWP